MKKQTSAFHRFLAMLCTVAMLLSMAPTSVLAQDPEEDPGTFGVAIAADGLAGDTLVWDTDNGGVQLTANVTAAPEDMTYVWESDNPDITVEGDGQTVTLQSSKKYGVTGNVSVTVSGTDAEQLPVQAVDSIQVKLTGTPKLEVSITTENPKAGDVLSAKVLLDGQELPAEACSYTWTRNGAALDGQTGFTCSTTKPGTYAVTAAYAGNDAAGHKAASAVAEVEVDALYSEVTVSMNTPTYGEDLIAKVEASIPGSIEIGEQTVELKRSFFWQKYKATVDLGVQSAGENISLSYTFKPKEEQYGEPAGTVQYTIKPKTVVPDAFELAQYSKVYDGSTEFAVSSVSLRGVLENDKEQVAANATAFVANTAAADAGENLNAVLGAREQEGLLSGEKAGNYALDLTGRMPTAEVSIEKKSVTLKGLTFEDKIYDGSAEITAQPAFQWDGLVGEEALTLTGAVYTTDDKNVGEAKKVAVDLEKAELAGEGSGNYVLNKDSVPQDVVITVVPKEVSLKYTGKTVQKNSDGTNALSRSNRAEIEKGIKLNGVVSGDDVTLEIGFDSAVYSDTSIFNKENTISGLVFTLTGEQKDNYSLQACDVPAKILSNKTDADSYDLSAQKDGTIAVVTSADVKVKFTQGTNLSSPDNGSFWYKEQPVFAEEQQVQLLKESGEKYTFAEPVQGENKADGIWLKTDTDVYYGPFAIKYLFDNEDPVIHTKEVKEIAFGGQLEYTFEVQDQDSKVGTEDSVAKGQIQYYVGSSNEEDLSRVNWENAEVTKNKDSYTFTIQASKAGYLYLRASDNAGNSTETNAHRALVLEKTAPQVTIGCDGQMEPEAAAAEAQEPMLGHTITIGAADPDDPDIKNGYAYSGIQKIEYVLTKAEDGAFVTAGYWDNKAPENLEGLGDVKTDSRELILENNNYNKYHGSYILKVTAYDFCGNKTIKTMLLVFDNTPPKVEISMGGNADPDGEYYYRADNGAVTVTVSDDYPEGVTGTVTLTSDASGAKQDGESSLSKELTEDNKGEITFTAQEVAKLKDGKITVTADIKDYADNKAAKFAAVTGLKDESEANEVPTASFVLDTVAPALKEATLTEGNEYESDQAIYYNKGFKAVYTVEEVNYDAKRVKSTAECEGGTAASLNAASPDAITLYVDGKAGVEKAVHTFGLTLTDKAGNALADTKLAAGQSTVTVQDGVLTVADQLVLDTLAPVLKDASLTKGNQYKNDQTIYYNKGFEAVYTVEEVNYDPMRVKSEAKCDGGTAAKLNAADPAAITLGVENKAGVENAIHTFGLTLTDKAGNALANTELAAGQSTVTVQDGTLTVADQLVLDTVAPDLTSVSTENKGNPYDEGVYYNRGFDITFTVDEVNYDSRKQEGDGHSVLTVLQDGEPVEPDGENIAVNKTTVTDDGNDTKTRTVSVTVKEQDTARTTYDIALNVTDKAGNKMTMSAKPDAQNAVTMQDGTASLKRRIMDTVDPVLTIGYPALEEEYFYQQIGGDENTSLIAYYDDSFTTSFSFADEGSLDGTKLHYVAVRDGKDGEDTAVSSEKGEEIKELEMTFTTSEDGIYNYKVWGVDKAGNELRVIEPDRFGPDKGIDRTGYGTQELCFTTAPKVQDTVAPEYTLSLADPDKINKSVDGNRAYYNNDVIEGTFTVTDTNLDTQRISAVLAGTAGTDMLYDQAEVDWAESNPGKSDKVEDLNSQPYTLSIKEDGVYRFQIEGTDRAGNKLVPSKAEGAKEGFRATSGENGRYRSEIKVRDTVAPAMNIALNNGNEDFYKAMVSGEQLQPSFNQPYQRVDHATGTLAREDCSPTVLSGSVWSSIPEKAQTIKDEIYSHSPVGLVFKGAQMLRLTNLYIEDRAGNVSHYKGETNTIYLDVEAPNEDNLKPTVEMVTQVGPLGHGPEGNDLYDKTVNVRTTVTDPGANINSSGLYRVYYKVLVNGEDWSDKVAVSSESPRAVLDPATKSVWYSTRGGEAQPLEKDRRDASQDEELTFQDVLNFTFDANTFNYNDIKIYAWAEDNSGNLLTEAEATYYFFGIDITTPTIDVRYDNNSAENDKYFKADRTATVTVTERNFDPDHTAIDTQSGLISGWRYVEGTLPNHDDDKWVCTVEYNTDGDYTFDMTTADRVGHRAKGVDYGDSVAPTEFTVDKTAPVIEISFDNNNVLNDKYYSEVRTATVRIDEHNFWTEGVGLTTTANIQEGTVSAPSASAWSSTGDVNTATVPFTSDGNYTMNVEFVDLAGNKAEPKSVDEFVVDTTAPELEVRGVEDRHAYNGEVAPSIVYHDINCDDSTAQVAIRGYKHPEGSNLNGVRTEDIFGGSFVCENIEPIKENDDIYTATGSITDLAGNKTEASVVFSVNRYGSTYMFADDTKQLLDNYYTNTSPSLHIIEVNVAQLDSNLVTTSLNGELTTLEQGSDYTVQESMPGWYQYDYKLNAANFEKEGTYDITLSSKDKAGNTNSNHAIKENDARTEDLPISFVVDKTAPVNIVTGVENRAQYIAAERTIVVNYDDNIALNSLQLYVDSEVVAEYTAEQLKNAGGSLQYVAKAANHWQQFSVVSTDMAGNTSEQTTVNYLLTGNLLVQYYNNKPLFYGSLAGIAVLAALAAFIVTRKKKAAQQPVNSQAK